MPSSSLTSSAPLWFVARLSRPTATARRIVRMSITGTVCAVIVAAGRSERMGGIDKIYTEVAGRPLIAWTLAAFKRCDAIDSIVIVAAPDGVARMEAFVAEWRMTKVRAVVAGGETRQDSVRAGIEATDATVGIIAIHDAARLLVTPDIIERGIALARETGAALCATPARDTIKQVAGDPPVVTATPDRASMWIAQTPQVFARDIILRAHREAATTATDDAALVEAIGHPVRVYEGAPWNIKITTPEDVTIAEALIRARLTR